MSGQRGLVFALTLLFAASSVAAPKKPAPPKSTSATAPAKNAPAIPPPVEAFGQPPRSRPSTSPRLAPASLGSTTAARWRASRYIELAGEDHWLSRSENRIRTLKELERFLAQHLGPAGRPN